MINLLSGLGFDEILKGVIAVITGTLIASLMLRYRRFIRAEAEVEGKISEIEISKIKDRISDSGIDELIELENKRIRGIGIDHKNKKK